MSLGNYHEIRNFTTAIAGNGSANKHVSTAMIALQQKNGIFYAVHAEIL
jgi:hypothetical protein